MGFGEERETVGLSHGLGGQHRWVVTNQSGICHESFRGEAPQAQSGLTLMTSAKTR